MSPSNGLITYIADDVYNECKLALSSDGTQLYTIDKMAKGSRYPQAYLQIYDLTSNGSLIKRKSMGDQSIRKMALMAKDK